VRTAVGLLFFIIPTLLTVAYPQNTSVRTANKNSSAKMPKFVNPGWTEDELLFSRVISTRAEKLEEKTGFHFDKNWTPKVSLEWNLGAGAVGFDGLYKAETQTTYFPIRILYELTARQKQSSSSLNADTAAADAEFAELLATPRARARADGSGESAQQARSVVYRKSF
jgi:hypothetical protein